MAHKGAREVEEKVGGDLVTECGGPTDREGEN